MTKQVFINGKVYTAHNNEEVTAFVVEDGVFAFVGSDEEALAFAGFNQAGGAMEAAADDGEPQAELRDLKGVRVIPGMIDTHCHYLAMCLMSMDDMLEIDLSLSHEETLALVESIAQQYSVQEMPVINGLGYGVDCKALASELDRAVSDRPVYLIDSGGHEAWMNSKMIALAGLTPETPDPVPGVSYYSRDEQGMPNGRVTEALVLQMQIQTGRTGVAAMLRNLPSMTTTLHKLGLVAAYDAGFLVADESTVLEALSTTTSSFDFYTSFHFNTGDECDSFIKKMIELRETYSLSWVHPTTLKMFKDGTLEAQTAWMFEDYFKPASGCGGEIIPFADMKEMARLASAEGFNVHVHAIGDRAISEALDLFEALGSIEGTKAMAHVQVLPEDGIERFAEQGDVFYQTTPLWLYRDDYTLDVLGKERALRQMPLKSLLDRGVKLTFGSDAPVSGGLIGMNPFNNIQAAVNRAFDSENLIDPPSEGIDLASCIDAYTINAAAQVGAAHERGSIEAGKRADFVLLSQDPFSAQPELIDRTEVLETWAQGACVFCS